MTKLLALAETDGRRVLETTYPTLTFAQTWAQATDGTFDVLLTGYEITACVENVQGFGAEAIYVADAPELEHPLAERVAAVGAAVLQQSGAGSVAGPSSTFGRDILPRVAGLLDLPMASDVLSVERGAEGLLLRRPMFAGNLIATVQMEGSRGVFSVRGTAFGNPARSARMSALMPLDMSGLALPQRTRFVSLDAPERTRPELTGARVVVSGGRPLRDAETFERLLGGVADKLGGAVGATRAAVDSGLAPNELQIGQTGKVVAPELYIAAGVSGSVQHLAGMKDSKVIVAINTDPDAPIFQVADYGLVADLHQALPELAAKL